MTSSSVSPSAVWAAAAASRCPQWIGSNVPPRMPTRFIATSLTGPSGVDTGRMQIGLVAGEMGPDGLEQSGHAGAGDGGDTEERQAERRCPPLEILHEGGVVHHVDSVHLVGCDELRSRREARLKQRELAPDGFEVVHRIPSTRAGDVHDVHEHLRALQVTKKLVPQTEPAMRALDQAGDVGDNEAAVA